MLSAGILSRIAVSAVVVVSWLRPFDFAKPERFFVLPSCFAEMAVLHWLSMRPLSFFRYMKDLRNRTWSAEPGVANLC